MDQHISFDWYDANESILSFLFDLFYLLFLRKFNQISRTHCD
ncbi:hypothetical protein NBRC111894_1795 [Sporolactobacillus inulinus]|uniref:Uncharacterized protein n=1 Tax=Sporolactobacillus inulinus TaxID=2078 RepID=A0A4Y1ZBE4_9BACL|nr:hypothetical protein NBRC111894_1795 [Sporolactobacillus inulinus]